MTSSALLLALLHALTVRSPVQAEYGGDYMVRTVYELAGLDGVAVVWMESQFNPRAQRREPRGHTSYGLWQLDSEWHPQFRDDVGKHIEYGAGFWNKCLRDAGGNFTIGVRLFNSGSRTGGVMWADLVREKRDSLAMYVWEWLRRESW